MITVDPPVVHPSLGEIALITGMADVGDNPGYSAEGPSPELNSARRL